MTTEIDRIEIQTRPSGTWDYAITLRTLVEIAGVEQYVLTGPLTPDQALAAGHSLEAFLGPLAAQAVASESEARTQLAGATAEVARLTEDLASALEAVDVLQGQIDELQAQIAGG